MQPRAKPTPTGPGTMVLSLVVIGIALFGWGMYLGNGFAAYWDPFSSVGEDYHYWLVGSLLSTSGLLVAAIPMAVSGLRGLRGSGLGRRWTLAMITAGAGIMGSQILVNGLTYKSYLSGPMPHYVEDPLYGGSKLQPGTLEAAAQGKLPGWNGLSEEQKGQAGEQLARLIYTQTGKRIDYVNVQRDAVTFEPTYIERAQRARTKKMFLQVSWLGALPKYSLFAWCGAFAMSAILGLFTPIRTHS